MNRVLIGDISSQIRGVSYKKNDVVDEPTERYTPVMRANNINEGFLNYDKLVYVKSEVIKEHQLLQKGDVLICASSGSLNLVGKAGSFLDSTSSSFGAFCKVLRPDTKKVFPRFFHFYFQSQGYKRSIKALAEGANINNIKNEHLDDLKIPLPSLEEQKRIAAILDKADELRQKRREAISQCNEFLKSTFLSMFGDPVTNPKGWDKIIFDELLDNIDGGWSPKCETWPATLDEWGVMKLGALTTCEYKEEENKAMLPGLETKSNIEIQPRDLLFSRKNTHELVAACAYVWDTRPQLMMSDLMFRFKFKASAEVNSIYMWKLLVNERQRKEVQALASGAAGSMPNISKKNLKTIKLPIPPIELQNQFAEIAKKTESSKSQMQQSLKELDDNFDALMQKAFKGEL
ncbi:putative restriction-modification system specificity determinant [Lentisphaera araneosa HTCC2155]|uniref:Putative restriction-modification system specificity determinant n=1 Tax=Lentisphaera araneosa HTCC2155 TaxID=313628 RepID=A6DQ81_9BACT|nr:restriction endonuclease subunit S [Lentisphaera araneosa]EDM26132.1 putative restriction-modification system specificity determinant [Lentisphaera araneosa HTCC2155]